MTDKQLYYVHHQTGDWCKDFLVKANSQKEAIDITFIEYFVWRNTKEAKEQGYKSFTKSDLKAIRVDRLFAEGETDCVMID